MGKLSCAWSAKHVSYQFDASMFIMSISLNDTITNSMVTPYLQVGASNKAKAMYKRQGFVECSRSNGNWLTHWLNSHFLGYPEWIRMTKTISLV